jgi:hypothetical protein
MLREMILVKVWFWSFVFSVLVSDRRESRTTQGIQQCVLQALVSSLAPPLCSLRSLRLKGIESVFIRVHPWLKTCSRGLTPPHTIGLNSRPACAMLSEIHEAQ